MKNVSVHIEKSDKYVFYDSFKHNDGEFVVVFDFHEGFKVEHPSKYYWLDLEKAIHHKSDKFAIGSKVKSGHYGLNDYVVLANFKEVSGQDCIVLFRNGWHQVYDASEFELVD